MDLIRAVLGEKKINYLGFSYGTYLGAVYGSLFPQNLNRSVLDSSVNPNWLWREQQLQVGVAAKQNVDAWATWVAQRNKTYGLGTSLAQVTTNLDALGVKLAAKPVPPISPPMPKNFPVDRVFFDSILGAVTSDRSQWDILGQVVDQLSAEATSSAKLSPDASTALGLMAEQTLSGIAKTESGVYQAVTCEADWPSDPATYYDDMRLYREKYPYGGGAMAAEPSNCTFRSFTPPEKLVDLKRKGYPAGLVLQGEYDGETQYEGGPAMASKLDDNLVSVTDEGVHGLYASNACATERIDDYLINGILPGSRSLCAGEPRPDVPADNAPAVPKAKSGQSLASQEQAIIAKDKLNRNF
jgi:pimeloyl-ACP methyl ester carboxylesterase